VFNDGPGAAADVIVSDYLDQHITMVSGLPAQCRLVDRTVSCDLGTVAAGAGRRITFTAHVGPAVPAGTNIENCGTVASTSPQTSGAGKDSCTSTTITPVATNVSMVKTGPATALPGDTVTYTLTVTNHGTVDARNEAVSDDLSGELGAITAVSAPCLLSGRTISCALGTLAAGASRTFTVTGTVSPSAAAGTAIPNCADETTTTPETDDDDNGSCTATIVGSGVIAPPPGSANVAVTKTGPATAAPDGTVSYTLTVTNRGSVDARNTVVSDVLGSELTVTGLQADARWPAGP
jgi:uncharacterized repeat protein (TIGR01451 family)